LFKNISANIDGDSGRAIPETFKVRNFKELRETGGIVT
jgi:hypothetical protein